MLSSVYIHANPFQHTKHTKGSQELMARKSNMQGAAFIDQDLPLRGGSMRLLRQHPHNKAAAIAATDRRYVWGVARGNTALIPPSLTLYSQHCLRCTTGPQWSGTDSFLRLGVCQTYRQPLVILPRPWEKGKPHVNATHLDRLARHRYARVRPSRTCLREPAAMTQRRQRRRRRAS